MSRVRSYAARAGFAAVEGVGIYFAGKGTDLASVAAGAGAMAGGVAALCWWANRNPVATP